MIMAAARSIAARCATGSSTDAGHDRGQRALVGRDILGQFEMHRARPLLLRDRKASRTRVGICAADDLRAILVSGRMVATMSTIWKRAWRLLMDRLLAGDHDHRHRAEMRVGRARRQIERAGTERRQADAGVRSAARRWPP
jgi:hypothetical protein